MGSFEMPDWHLKSSKIPMCLISWERLTLEERKRIEPRITRIERIENLCDEHCAHN